MNFKVSESQGKLLALRPKKLKNSSPTLPTCFGRGLNSPIFCFVFRYILCAVHACVYEFMHTCRCMYTCACGDPNLMSSVFLPPHFPFCLLSGPLLNPELVNSNESNYPIAPGMLHLCLPRYRQTPVLTLIWQTLYPLSHLQGHISILKRRNGNTERS